MYDTFEVMGNCRDCGRATEWHIDGEYPLCPSCMINLIYDVAVTNPRVEESEHNTRAHLKSIANNVGDN